MEQRLDDTATDRTKNTAKNQKSYTTAVWTGINVRTLATTSQRPSLLETVPEN
jgi:hypothetical protein